MDIINSFFIFGAVYIIYLMTAIILFVCIKGRPNEKKAFLLILISLPISFLLIRIIHLFFLETRPFIANNFTPLIKQVADASFPSRHATIAGVLVFSFLYFKSKWGLILLILAIWVGISRIYVGVHYTWDILGGFGVAAVSLIIPLVFFRIYQHFQKGQ